MNLIYFTCFFWVLPLQIACCQLVETLQIGNLQGDSSYYDIFEIHKGEFWIGGKSGILKKYTETNGLRDVYYPNLGRSILRINKLGDKILIASDQGTLYISEKGEWTTQQFLKHSKSCFYDLMVVDSLTAFICGGRSKIAIGKRVVPHGFIFKTQDGGNTWNPVFRSFSKMVWRLKYDTISQEILALTYSPLGSQVYSGGNRGDAWKKAPWKDRNLYHDLDISSNRELILVGGRSGNLRNQAGHLRKCSIQNENSNPTMNFECLPGGLIWDYTSGEKWELASSGSGNLWYREKNKGSNWDLIKMTTPLNLYEVIFYDENAVLVIGSKKSIFKVTLPMIPNSSLNSVELQISGQTH